MKKKNIIWHKVKNETYQRVEYHGESMATLSLFFEDGLYFQTYIYFLKYKQEEKFYGNISTMEKSGRMVTICIHEEIFPNMPPFTTTIENMISILTKYDELYYAGVDRIEISFDDDKLSIKGDWLQ